MNEPRRRAVGRSGVLIEGGLTIYIDPEGPVDGLPKADLVLLTPARADGACTAAVEALSTPSTIVCGPKDCVASFRLNQMPLRFGQPRSVLGVLVDLTEDGGFLLTVDGAVLRHPDKPG